MIQSCQEMAISVEKTVGNKKGEITRNENPMETLFHVGIILSLICKSEGTMKILHIFSSHFSFSLCFLIKTISSLI